MSSFEYFAQGLVTSVQPGVILYIFGGVVWGIIGGAIPGISASIAMALILPLTYGMDPTISLPMLAAVYVGAEYGGSIPAILIKTPGTGAAAATVLDGWELNQQGKGGKALTISLYAGVIGGLVSVILLVAATVPLASFALRFGPSEYFWMAMVGLSIVGSLAGSNPMMGLISACFGLFLAMIGMDIFTGTYRFTFGIQRLSEGLELVPVLVGMFALSEVFKQIFEKDMDTLKDKKFKMTYASRKELLSITPLSVGCGVLGGIVGALPGAGATISSWLAYTQARLLCKGGAETFGKGDIRGVAAPESANNGVPCGALIPLLALGIPGSNSTAILMGGFTIAGLTCGPMLFVTHPEVPYTLMSSMFVAQIAMLILGFFLLKPAMKIVSVNKIYLTGAVVIFAVVGAFAILNDVFACWLIVAFGVIGFLMKYFGFSVPAAVLGFVLGELVEDNMRRAMQLSQGDPSIFFSSTIDIILIVLTALGILLPYATKFFKNRKVAKSSKTA